MTWDKYAPFYDWENSRTMGRRDLPFWTEFVSRRGRVLELGCGTGRVLIPLARRGAALVGVDRSPAMLDRARQRVARLAHVRRPRLVLGDICELPFRDRTFQQVIGPYGVLQSLTSDSAFDTALAEAARVLKPKGLFALELVPDLQNWADYQRQVRFRGRLGSSQVTLVESVRKDPKRGLTIFDEEFTTRAGRRSERHQFSLVFRTLALPTVIERLERAGLKVTGVQGDYRGGAWTPESGVWIVVARR